MLERIRELCRLNNISLRKLEVACGLGNGAIARWENNDAKASSIRKVADYFGVSVDYILGREGYAEAPVIITQTETISYPVEVEKIINLLPLLNNKGKEIVFAVAKGLTVQDKYSE